MNELQFLIYTADNDSETASVIIKGETIWASQKEMARLFGVGVPAISKHLKNILQEVLLYFNQLLINFFS